MIVLSLLAYNRLIHSKQVKHSSDDRTADQVDYQLKPKHYTVNDVVSDVEVSQDSDVLRSPLICAIGFALLSAAVANDVPGLGKNQFHRTASPYEKGCYQHIHQELWL